MVRPIATEVLPAASVRLMLRHLIATGWPTETISAETELSVPRLNYLRLDQAKTVYRVEAALIWSFYATHYDRRGQSAWAASRASSEGYLEIWRVAPHLVPPAHRPNPALSVLSIHQHELRVRKWLVGIRQTPFWDILARPLDYYLTHRFVLVMSDEEALIRAFKFRSSIPLLTNSAFSSVTGIAEPRIRWLTRRAILILLSQPTIPINGHADDLNRYLVTLAVA